MILGLNWGCAAACTGQVRARWSALDRAAWYVGQPRTLSLDVEGVDGGFEVQFPELVWAESAVVQAQQGGPGRRDWVVVPRQAGAFRIPAVRVVGDFGSTLSPMLGCTVVPIPLAGRDAAFLGGVGPVSIEARITGEAVRVGRAFARAIRLTGPGAVGVDLERLSGMLVPADAGLEVVSTRVERSFDPIACTLSLELRPTRAGLVVFPPVRITTFDPESQRFEPRMVPSGRVRVAALPPYVEPSQRDSAGRQRVPEAMGGFFAAMGISLAIGLAFTFAARPRPLVAVRLYPDRRMRRMAARRAERVRAGPTDPEWARELAGWVASLVYGDAARVAPTPLEVEHAARSRGWDAGLARGARWILEACDRARFGRASFEESQVREVIDGFGDWLRRLEEEATKRERRGVFGGDQPDQPASLRRSPEL